MGDVVTDTVVKPYVQMTDMAPIPDDIPVDSIPLPAPQAEAIVEEIPIIDSGMHDVQDDLQAT